MSDLTGKNFLHYEILAHLGRGGMGVVYKARDTRLLRLVALKFLHPRSLDAQARARFLQEARAASILNHPNICTVYDIGEFESRNFIVMEYVDGQTLREILDERGPLPEQDIVKFCLDICSALQATHAKGIVHRDIKPENIIVTRDRRVKIMDFGLAKLAGSEPQAAAIDSDNSGPSHTQAGQSSVSFLEGTIHYMSPEQIDKIKVDARTDIYSLGVVMYELLAGQKPFAAANNILLLKAILNQEPAPVTKVRPGCSKPMNRAVVKALEKDPKHRFQSMEEMRKQLEQIGKPRTASFKPVRAYVVPALLIIAAMAAILIRLAIRPDKALAPVSLKLQGLNLSQDADGTPAFSADGQRIAFLSLKTGGEDSQTLNIKNLVTGETKSVYHSSSSKLRQFISGLDWSPDNRLFAAAFENGGIVTLDTAGAEITQRVDFGYSPRWSPDMEKIAFTKHPSGSIVDRNEIWLYHLRNGNIDRLSPETAFSYDSPSWSPDGRWIICVGGVGSERRLWVINTETGHAHKFFQSNIQAESPIWARSGNFVYFATKRAGMRGLYRVRVHAASAEASSEPEAVISDILFNGYRISSDGKRLVYGTSDFEEQIFKASLETEPGKFFQSAELLAAHTTFTTNIAVSPDGEKLLLETSAKGARNLVLFDPAHHGQTTLYDEQDAYAPCWSPDGQWLVFDAGGGDHADIWRIAASGGNAKKIIEHPGADWMPTYSPDGKELCVLSNRGGPFDLWLVSLMDGKSRQITSTPEQESGGYWSHDGRRIAYFRHPREDAGAEVLIYDLDKNREQTIYEIPGRQLEILTKIIWHPDDAAIYFDDRNGLLKLNVHHRNASYVVRIGQDLTQHFRYDLDNRHLYLTVRKPHFANLWMIEGLE